jgi:hypothetical protein
LTNGGEAAKLGFEYDVDCKPKQSIDEPSVRTGRKSWNVVQY